MQKVAAYLMERYDGMEWAEVRSSEAVNLKSQIESWLGQRAPPAIRALCGYTGQSFRSRKIPIGTRFGP